MDVHGHLLRYYRSLSYCFFSLVILNSCSYEITIQIDKKQRGESPTPTDSQNLGGGTDTKRKPSEAAECIITEAKGFIGESETAPNRGKGIEAIQREAGIPLGSPWCQAFVLVCYNRCKVSHKMDGRAVSACQKMAEEIKAGDVICFDWNGNGRIQHSGIIEKEEEKRFVTIEGNTSDPEKIKPEGVYRKFRSKSLRYVAGTWLR